MPFEEKMTWVNLVITVVVPVWYLVTMAGRLGDASAADVAYQRPMLIAFGVYIGLTIIGAAVDEVDLFAIGIPTLRHQADFARYLRLLDLDLGIEGQAIRLCSADITSLPPLPG